MPITARCHAALNVGASRALLLVGVLMLSGWPAFAATETGSSAAAASSAGADAQARLRELIGDAACDRDEQCHTVAIGQKSCGGPQAYLAWSDRLTDVDAIGRLVARYNVAQASARLDDGRVSTCEFIADPGAVCAEGTSRTASGSSKPYRSCQLRGKPGRPRLIDR